MRNPGKVLITGQLLAFNSSAYSPLTLFPVNSILNFLHMRHTFIFQVSWGLFSISSLLTFAPVSLAGDTIIRGAAIDSSFAPLNPAFTTPNPGIVFQGDNIIVTDQVQSGLNKSINEIFNSNQNQDSTVIALIRGDNITLAKQQIIDAFSKVGVDVNLTTELSSRLEALFNSQSVDINQLNAAIKIYNQIVSQTGDSNLIALSELPEFKKVAEVLKQLRRTVDCSTRIQSNECINL